MIAMPEAEKAEKEAEPPADPGTPDDEGGAIDTFAQSAATPLPEIPSQYSPLPGTMVFLAGIGLLAAGLGAGFIHYRRRQL